MLNRFLVSVNLLVFIIILPVVGQPPFQDEIKAFKRQDIETPPPRNAILFVGSSSFRMWKDLQTDFPGKKLINRGFGGSTFEDILRYADEIILPYQPKQIVIYCGENDLAGGVPVERVVDQFKQLFQLIRSHLPAAHIVFVSIKPSPSRHAIIEQVKKTNRDIERFIAGQQSCAYVDIFSKMMGKDDKPREELFVNDRLHMNRSGYDIWKDALTPFLE